MDGSEQVSHLDQAMLDAARDEINRRFIAA